MKTFLLLIASTLSIFTVAQTDTLRMYYQNGNLASVQPNEDGEMVLYYITGEVKSITSYNTESKTNIGRTFYKSGSVHVEYGQNSSNMSYSKTYFENGNLALLNSRIKNGNHTEIGYENGNPKSKATMENGSPISCFSFQQKDSSYTKKSCLSRAIPVYWKSDHWEDIDGNEVNREFKYSLIEYDSNGNETLRLKQLGNNQEIETRIKDKWVKTKSIDTGKLTMYPYRKPEGVATNIDGGEGYPLMTEPNPPRDTVIITYTIKKLADNKISWSIRKAIYNNLGQLLTTYKNDKIGKLIPSENKDYATYSSGLNDFNISFQISTRDITKAKVTAGVVYQHFATKGEVDVVWE